MSIEGTGLFCRDPACAYPVIVRGDGIYLYDSTGKRYIDGSAGASNVTLGHGRRRIVEAMAEQAGALAYCFSDFFTNQPAMDLASRISALAPGPLNTVYLVSGGSEGIETAFKMARLYHLQRGNAQKQMVISRWRGYHGATLCALGATGLPGLRAPFEPWLPSFPKIAPCYPYRCTFAGCQGQCNLTCARELERMIVQAGPENVAAFIGEPVVFGGVAGSVPPSDYYPLIREICDKYDVLFIADEIVTGFGRTGRTFAIEHWDVVPDLIVFGKGISSGYFPLAGVIFHDRVREALNRIGKPFPHVFTYVNNPLAARVGLEVLDIIEEENILRHVTELSAYLHERVNELRAHRIVGDVRGLGFLLGIELVRDRQTREPFPASSQINKHAVRIMREKGLSISATAGTADWTNGHDLRFYPPLIISRDQIDEAVAILDEGLGELEREAGGGP